jgi:hypothetical protein
MKKDTNQLTKKKLKLTVESIRWVSGPELAQVIGGGQDTHRTSCNTGACCIR